MDYHGAALGRGQPFGTPFSLAPLVFIFEIIVAAWFFVVGSAIGSFINVVVYRSQRRESIIGSSRCPQCGAAIRWRDNLPIAGWFLLKGKCRDCGQPISFRYPTVEFVTACLFLVLAIAELFSGGANLPGYAADASAGFAGVIADTHWPLVRIYTLHIVLLSTLFCWGLIRVDDGAVPPIQMWGMWLLAIAAVLIWPDVLPLQYTGAATQASDLFAQADSFRTAVFGFIAAGVIYLIWTVLYRWVYQAAEPKAQNTAFAAAITSIGLVLGWQAVVSILFLAALSRGIFTLSSFRSPKLRSTPLLVDLLLGAVIHLCFWSRLWMLPSWPGAGNSVAALLGAVIALLVLAFATPPRKAPDG